ncbi:Calcium permeable stress-gated cation channel 1 [Psilocybe cubensis]|uniref:DUF221-domain-containing protein n=2 Tax=Psilocybe cubensis TaxID=181762 RepID=A0A8H7XWC4_PSICU|nr:Calcium permeable stress-gated cation channel 1 [Psilocybe cubensis]KAH9475924.1 Calcium permeable stress-gated cation channel 1 [Psilocybe cubensis]
MSADLLGALLAVVGDEPDSGGGGSDEPGKLPPGSPPTLKFEGPWFTTQLTISLTVGVLSFLIFSYCRTRWPLLFAPRTKLKGFSPHEAHAHQAFFGWIMPTIRTSEFTVLQIVGLDAAVLLNFFKMSFYLFSLCSMFAVCILMPINWKRNKHLLDDDDDDWPGGDNSTWPLILHHLPILTTSFSFSEPPSNPNTNHTSPLPPDWLDLISDATTYLSTHLLLTYLFTILALILAARTYRRFLRARQLFSLELVHSIPARTVLLTGIPRTLRAERRLAEYWENMGLGVESVSLVREVGGLKGLLDERTKRLLALERCWVDYVGNPSTLESYDPESSGVAPLVDIDIEDQQSSQQNRLVVPHRPRPTLRARWFGPKVDALEHLEARFLAADARVKRTRRTGKFRPTSSAFITFEKMSSAQIALQVAHSPLPPSTSSSGEDALQMHTYPAPEPRDIVWSNMSLSPRALLVRDALVTASLGLLFFFWFFPITSLAGLLSYEEVKKTVPWLGRLIDRREDVRAVVQNSLPSVAMISLNGALPFILEGLTYVQGYRARSWVEFSLLKKYFLFLLVNVVFIFLFATTYWQLVQDLANSPAKVPEKLAIALQAGRARHFFLSYVILQGIGIMPLQLLNLGVIIPRVFYRVFYTRTPRDFAELNAPPMINYGVVYPQAILMFVITMLYSIVQPLIVIFGAVYFGVGYVVYKYKLLFVFYKPYESQGQAWPITYIRLIWGLVIYLLFMIGIFTLRHSYILSTLLLPLLAYTLLCGWYTHRRLRPLSKYVALSEVFEVQRGEEGAEVQRLREGHPVTWSQSHLNRRRYAQNDDTLYVAPEDERTDYSQPPMANWYSGVLNTGKRRYGHPALNGVLPEPWLPLKKGQALVNSAHHHHRGEHQQAGGGDQAVVLTLRKRYSVSGRSRRLSQEGAAAAGGVGVGGNANGNGGAGGILADPSAMFDPWQGAASASTSSHAAGPSGQPQQRPHSHPTPRRAHTHPHALSHRLSYDHASGVIMLPDDGAWLSDHSHSSDDDDDDDSEVDYGVQGARANGLALSESMISEGAESEAAAAAMEAGEGVPLGLGGVGGSSSTFTSASASAGAAAGTGAGVGTGASTSGGGAAGAGTGTGTAGPGAVMGMAGLGQSIGQRLSRYGTYFHHPERRRTGSIANVSAAATANANAAAASSAGGSVKLPGAFPTR